MDNFEVRCILLIILVNGSEKVGVVCMNFEMKLCDEYYVLNYYLWLKCEMVYL